MVSNSTNGKVLIYSLFQLYHLIHSMHINFICFFVSFKTSWRLFITFCLQSILLAATVKSEKVKEQDQNFFSHTLKFLINNGADISVILSPKEKKIHIQNIYTLQVKNGSFIQNYGKAHYTCSCSFIIVHVKTLFTSENFIVHFDLSINMKNKILTINLSSPGVRYSWLLTRNHSVTLPNNQYTQFLKGFLDIPNPFKHIDIIIVHNQHSTSTLDTKKIQSPKIHDYQNKFIHASNGKKLHHSKVSGCPLFMAPQNHLMTGHYLITTED